MGRSWAFLWPGVHLSACRPGARLRAVWGLGWAPRGGAWRPFRRQRLFTHGLFSADPAAVRRVALVPAALRLWLYRSMSPVKEGPALGSPGVSASTFVNICQRLPRVNAALIGSYRQRVSIVAWVPSAYKKNGLLWPLVFPGSGSILWAAPPLSRSGGVRLLQYTLQYTYTFSVFPEKIAYFLAPGPSF